jgi:hypothetical protein
VTVETRPVCHNVIQLNRLDWHDFLDRPNPVASALMAKMRIARKDRPRVKAECLRLMTSLPLDMARMELISTFVDTYLRLNASERQVFDDAVAEFAPPQKEQAMKIMTSWELEGIEKGKVEGRVEGRVEEAQILAIRQLRRRFDGMSEVQEAHINRLTLERLEDLAIALLDFTQPGDLDSWLTATADSVQDKDHK